jgi:hypothetical protein
VHCATTSLSDYRDALQPYRSTFAAGFDFPARLRASAAPVDAVAAAVVAAALAADPRPRYRPATISASSTTRRSTRSCHVAGSACDGDGDSAFWPAGSLQGYGGAIASIGNDQTAFSHRDALVEFVAAAKWTNPAEDEARLTAAR